MRCKRYRPEHARQQKPHGSQHKAEPKWFVTEAGDRVHCVLDAAHEAELALAADTVLAVVVHNRGPISDPRAKTRQIAVSLSQVVEGVQHSAVQQAENTGVQ